MTERWAKLDGPALIAIGVFLAVAVTPLGSALESRMFTHVLIQIPLLVAVGFVLGQAIEPQIGAAVDRFNGTGIPGILTVSFTLAFWMIPRWLDGSLTSAWIETAKYSSLIVLAGVPLAWSWRRLHPIARGVVKIEFLSMLFRLGWLYLIFPERLCNNYLFADQIELGRGLIVVAIALSITWMVPVFFGEVFGVAAASKDDELAPRQTHSTAATAHPCDQATPCR